MSNIREEILKSAIIRLQSNSEAIMLEINILLSKPEGIEKITDQMTELLARLAISENALIQAKTLYSQSMSQRMEMLSNLVKAKSNDSDEVK